MSISAYAPLETEVPVFDVIVEIRTGVTTEQVSQLAQKYGELSSSQIEGLMRAFQNGPRVKVGDHVPKERADAAKEMFSKLGLNVSVIPQLSIEVKKDGDFDGRFLCRACNTRVDLPANRQCPNCQMFVDKITDEWLLKQKIMEQERAKLDSRFSREDAQMKKAAQKSMEDALRAKIREELEEEYGVKKEGGLFQGKSGLLRLGGLAGFVAAAFVVGGMIPPGKLPWSKGSQSAQATADAPKGDIDKMLNNVGVQDASGTGSAGAGHAAGATGDADVDDPMLQELTGGKKMGGPGLTMEQAIAASRTLAAGVGNTTFDRATGAGAAPMEASSVTVAPVTKHLLGADFARELASIGQWKRARAIVKLVKPLAVQTEVIAALQGADLEAQAWGMQSLAEGKARQAMEMIIADAKQVVGASDRARALGRVAAIVSQHSQLPPDASRVFLTLAGDAVKSVASPKEHALAMGEWVVSLGQVLSNEAIAHVKAGRSLKAQVAADHLQALTRDASEPSAQALVNAMIYRVNLSMGHQDKADKALNAAMALVAKVPDILERAKNLRQVAQLSGNKDLAFVQSAAAALRAQLEAKPTIGKEMVYAQLSLMFQDFGMNDRADEYSRLALGVTGLTPAELGAIQAELMTRGDMARAKHLHQTGRYAEAESILQKIGGYFS